MIPQCPVAHQRPPSVRRASSGAIPSAGSGRSSSSISRGPAGRASPALKPSSRAVRSAAVRVGPAATSRPSTRTIQPAIDVGEVINGSRVTREGRRRRAVETKRSGLGRTTRTIPTSHGRPEGEERRDERRGPHCKHSSDERDGVRDRGHHRRLGDGVPGRGWIGVNRRHIRILPRILLAESVDPVGALELADERDDLRNVPLRQSRHRGHVPELPVVAHDAVRDRALEERVRMVCPGS